MIRLLLYIQAPLFKAHIFLPSGIWDVMSADDAWEVVQRAGKKGRGKWDLQVASRALADAAIERGSSDNVSVILVQLG